MKFKFCEELEFITKYFDKNNENHIENWKVQILK